MIEPWVLLAASCGLLVVAAAILRRAWKMRVEAADLAADARVTYDHASELYVEATKSYREATEAAVAARSANRQAFATMAALAEEGAHYRGTRH